MDAATLARKYGAREEALAGVLRHNAVPIVYELPGGEMVGDWPRAPRAAAAAAAAPAQEEQEGQQQSQTERQGLGQQQQQAGQQPEQQQGRNAQQ